MSALLIGNGLNRCLHDYPSWDGLLTSISNEFYCNLDSEESSILKYDMMLCNASAEFGAESIQVKLKHLLGVLNRPEMSVDELDFIASVQDCEIKTILTTNFDYNIETALLHSRKSRYRDAEHDSKYKHEIRSSNKRYCQIGDVRIQHIHGELNLPSTVCLGITKYAEALSKIMELLSDGKPAPDEMLQTAEIDDNVLLRKRAKRTTWAELIFNENVYIVGLALTSQELDLWWLLVRRAQLLNDSRREIKPTNRIVYFNIRDDKGPMLNPASFDSIHVETKNLTVTNGDWESAYRRAFSEIHRLENLGKTHEVRL